MLNIFSFVIRFLINANIPLSPAISYTFRQEVKISNSYFYVPCYSFEEYVFRLPLLDFCNFQFSRYMCETLKAYNTCCFEIFSVRYPIHRSR